LSIIGPTPHGGAGGHNPFGIVRGHVLGLVGGSLTRVRTVTTIPPRIDHAKQSQHSHFLNAAMPPRLRAIRESQRDSVPRPRVARHELPWVIVFSTKDRRHPKDLPQPLRGCVHFRIPTQGSSFLATLGWRTQSLWDCSQTRDCRWSGGRLPRPLLTERRHRSAGLRAASYIWNSFRPCRLTDSPAAVCPDAARAARHCSSVGRKHRECCARPDGRPWGEGSILWAM
jgi:hypothetical protein